MAPVLLNFGTRWRVTILLLRNSMLTIWHFPPLNTAVGDVRGMRANFGSLFSHIGSKTNDHNTIFTFDGTYFCFELIIV